MMLPGRYLGLGVEIVTRYRDKESIRFDIGGDSVL